MKNDAMHKIHVYMCTAYVHFQFQLFLFHYSALICFIFKKIMKILQLLVLEGCILFNLNFSHGRNLL